MITAATRGATNPFRGVGAKSLPALVQLGGLEPPTSCSTDRRSNQLSYNCILARPKKGGRTGRKLGATLRFGKAAALRKPARMTTRRGQQKTRARARALHRSPDAALRRRC